MPEVMTREEWETSDCLGKKVSRSGSSSVSQTTRYFLCGPCARKLQDPEHNSERCEHVPKPRCPSMKEDEQTMGEVLEKFLDTCKPKKNCSERHIDNSIHLLLTSISREWQCHECEYDDEPSEQEAFAFSHGVSWISDGIPGFCSWFVIRKCIMSENQKRQYYTVMSKLTDFLFKEKHIDSNEKKHIKSAIRKCRSVNTEKIIKALHDLKREGYWESLESDGEDSEDDDSEDFDRYEDYVESEMPLEVKEVTDDGWVFDEPDERKYEDPVYNSKDEDFHTSLVSVRIRRKSAGYLLKLPKEVAKLGKKGMSISGMSLRFRRGVWSPFDPSDDYDDDVCANVYPPCE